MLKFKLGVMLGFAAGWFVGSGRAMEMWQQMRSSGTDVPGAVASRVQPVVDRAADVDARNGGSTAVSA
jgi:hypothetical protein